MSNAERAMLVMRTDKNIVRIGIWKPQLDLEHWVIWLGIQAVWLSAEWAITGVTAVRVIGQIVIVVLGSIAGHYFIRWWTMKRVRKTFLAIFGSGYEPDIDQVKRVSSVSRWIRAIGQLRLEDGRTVVAISVPALKKTLFAVDTYRK